MSQAGSPGTPGLIANLTQHEPTAEQVEAGVVTIAGMAEIRSLLNFAEPPDAKELHRRAQRLSWLAQESGCPAAMIGGAPYLMGPLESALRAAGIRIVYSFSRRETIEKQLSDGGVSKRSLFRHVGWVVV